MKLLELLPLVGVYGRVKRQIWTDCFLIKPMDDDHPLVFCDMRNCIMKSYSISYIDLVADDWEVLK